MKEVATQMKLKIIFNCYGNFILFSSFEGESKIKLELKLLQHFEPQKYLVPRAEQNFGF